MYFEFAFCMFLVWPCKSLVWAGSRDVQASWDLEVREKVTECTFDRKFPFTYWDKGNFENSKWRNPPKKISVAVGQGSYHKFLGICAQEINNNWHIMYWHDCWIYCSYKIFTRRRHTESPDLHKIDINLTLQPMLKLAHRNARKREPDTTVVKVFLSEKRPRVRWSKI